MLINIVMPTFNSNILIALYSFNCKFVTRHFSLHQLVTHTLLEHERLCYHRHREEPLSETGVIVTPEQFTIM